MLTLILMMVASITEWKGSIDISATILPAAVLFQKHFLHQMCPSVGGRPRAGPGQGREQEDIMMASSHHNIYA